MDLHKIPPPIVPFQKRRENTWIIPEIVRPSAYLPKCERRKDYNLLYNGCWIDVKFETTFSGAWRGCLTPTFISMNVLSDLPSLCCFIPDLTIDACQTWKSWISCDNCHQEKKPSTASPSIILDKYGYHCSGKGIGHTISDIFGVSERHECIFIAKPLNGYSGSYQC